MITVNFKPGDTVKVYQKVEEVVTVAGKTKRAKTSEVKTRTQAFEGVVLAIRGSGENKSFTVRKPSYDGVFVERIWQVSSPTIDKIIIVSSPKKKPRRAKLYYLRTAKTETA
ncbi:50S ribosomal protein L19 [Candidatus Microgenomates bacterium]|nr:50S ribosomal protein L19 [Candidatus Microgenomates bacterium]